MEHAKKVTSVNDDGTPKKGVITKTSLMLGLGEKDEDIEKVLKDLRIAGVDVVTFGQYLRHHIVI